MYVPNYFSSGDVIQGQTIDFEYLIAHFQIIAIGWRAVQFDFALNIFDQNNYVARQFDNLLLQRKKKSR